MRLTLLNLRMAFPAYPELALRWMKIQSLDIRHRLARQTETNTSEEHAAYIFRVEKWAFLLFFSNPTEWRTSVTSHTTVHII